MLVDFEFPAMPDTASNHLVCRVVDASINYFYYKPNHGGWALRPSTQIALPPGEPGSCAIDENGFVLNVAVEGFPNNPLTGIGFDIDPSDDGDTDGTIARLVLKVWRGEPGTWTFACNVEGHGRIEHSIEFTEPHLGEREVVLLLLGGVIEPEGE